MRAEFTATLLPWSFRFTKQVRHYNRYVLEYIFTCDEYTDTSDQNFSNQSSPSLLAKICFFNCLITIQMGLFEDCGHSYE